MNIVQEQMWEPRAWHEPTPEEINTSMEAYKQQPVLSTPPQADRFHYGQQEENHYDHYM